MAGAMSVPDPQVSYEAVWPSPSAKVRDEAMAFWIEQNALPGGASPVERTSEIVMVARYEDRVVGLSTCRLVPVPQIGEAMYHYRTMVSPRVRMQQLGTQLLIRSFSHLAQHNDSLPDPEAAGIYTPRQLRAFGFVTEK